MIRNNIFGCGRIVGLGILAYLLLAGPTPLSAAEPTTAKAVVVPAPDAAGGGWADGGPLGAYFANPDFKGEPAFTRRDVRVDFHWGALAPIGGSPAEPYRGFPRDHFTVRWTGRVLPRFSENYVFIATADGGLRLKLKPAGAADWKTVIDQWDKSGVARSQPVALEAGKPCEVVLEYSKDAGAAGVSVAWSCPSAPEQVIDPVSAQGLNTSTWFGYCWANEAKIDGFGNQKNLDEYGYPKGDATLVCGGLCEGGGAGTYELSFQGQAEVSGRGMVAFSNGNQTWQNPVPRGAGYDAATNTTRLRFVYSNNDEGNWSIVFQQTSREGKDAKGDGVTNVRLMRPLKSGSDAPHRPDEIVHRAFKDAVTPYTCLRWLQAANARSDGRWAGRTPPGYCAFTRGAFFADDNTGGECWEYLIVMANECGKDLYVTLPVDADDDYFEQFARLVRYGSDGVKPYDHEVENPVWPPLNPNLRLYVEIGNEVWNWAFASSQSCQERAAKEAKDGTPDGKIINYDGHANWRRWHALRTVRAADAFRRVAGDAAIGSRIRMLLEYQWNNGQNTATHTFSFLDNWFNNGDGDHVAQPHPARYWIWGAGGATYYGCGNNDGHQDAVRLADPGFEAGAVASGTEDIAPKGCGWTCRGAAAIYRNWQVSTTGFTPGKYATTDKSIAAGCSLTVDKPTQVRALGCWLRGWMSYNVEGPTLILMGPKGPLAQTKVKAPRYDAWVWSALADPVQLEPGVAYHLLTQASEGQLYVFSEPVAVTAGPGFTITGAARVDAKDGKDAKAWKVEQAAAGSVAFWPVTLRCAASADAKPTTLPEPYGGQAAVLRAGGSLTTKVNFPKAGRYALDFQAIGGDNKDYGFLPFRITVGGKPANPKSRADERVVEGNFSDLWYPGNFEFLRSSGVFDIAKPGEVELVITAADKGNGWTAFDDIRVTSVDAIMDSGFGAGQALGNVAENNYIKTLNESDSFARSFGLAYVAYEAGWSLGGDNGARPIHTWCKFKEERVKGINDAAEDIFRRAGGFMNTWGVYTYWPPHDVANAATYPLWRSIAGMGARLPAEPTNGIALPGQAQPKASVGDWGVTNDGAPEIFSKRGDWRAWLVLAPKSGPYVLSVQSQGDGEWELEVDGVVVGRGGGAAGAAPVTVSLVRGQHGLRLRDLGGKFTLQSIEVRDKDSKGGK